MLEAVDGVALVEDVTLGFAEAVEVVDAADALVDGTVGDVLQAHVERGLDAEAVLVECLRAVASFQLLAHFLDEIRRDRIRASGGLRDYNRPRLGGVRLLLRDVVLVGHLLQHVGLPPFGALHIDRRRIAPRLKDAGNRRCFVGGQILRGLAEVGARRRLHPVGALAEVHLVGVKGQDFALGVALLDLDGDDRLFDFPLE